jgi:hypothetical protein
VACVDAKSACDELGVIGEPTLGYFGLQAHGTLPNSRLRNLPTDLQVII